VLHGHVKVNGRTIGIPSHAVEPGDVVALSDSMRTNVGVRNSLERAVQRGLPGWLEWDGNLAESVKRTQEGPLPEGLALAGRVKNWPSREEMSFPVNEQFIVELYSK
jgi:small subunit ribosomal protein S4